MNQEATRMGARKKTLAMRRQGWRQVTGTGRGTDSRHAGETPERQAALRAAQRAIDAVRADRLLALSRHLDQVLHAATWLIGRAIKIRAVHIARHAVVITVESTPFLWRLFAGECAWRERRADGAGGADSQFDVYTWFAVRYGVRIEWEERQWRG